MSATLVANAPLTIALGAAAFAAIAVLMFRKRVADSRREAERSGRQIAGLRAELDEYEALLSGAREITVLWTERGSPPRVFGPTHEVLAPGRRPEAILDVAHWLDPASAAGVAQAIEALRVRAESFSLDGRAQDGGLVRITGSVIGSGTALRIRPMPAAAGVVAQPPARPDDVETLLAGLALPAYRRGADGRVRTVNAAFTRLFSRRGGKDDNPFDPAPDLAKGMVGVPRSLELRLDEGRFEVTEVPLSEGSLGYLRPLPQALPAPAPSLASSSGGERLVSLVEALSLPAAVFDANYRLVAANARYTRLWQLGGPVVPGTDERTILDQLRRDGKLPTEPDYRGWRDRHLASYRLTGPRTESWHLPDGRMLNVTAAPAGPEGGVIYLFEDVSRELELVSQNRALLSVQRSTLNALSDAVAVFGTNGRLQLFNLRLSALWRVPTNFLEQHPHIDQIAAMVGKELPDDGAAIWRDLKRAVIDLSPTRADTSGRLTRSDGRLIDYSVVRLPDGQKLLSFLDVTESANYSRVLQERNEALVTADRLKDAFVQNVSYELRSPLTNIIGFADLLASPEVGPLNARQREYTDYIRASSVTLGVLIDSILDLATVDAGIAELRPEPQNIPALISKACAGLAASFPSPSGGTTVNLKVEMPPNLPPLIADGTRIVQVLYNLLSNAARFSLPGAEIRLTVAARAERVLFTVEDEGGLADDHRAELLERSASSGGPGRDRGAGLGLAIVRAFVNLHGGTFTLERRQPRGMRMVVNLPRDASAAATTAAE
ncbi:MAG TPA: PAS-domain containing protein [Devosiaceae bacterium]|nr:PAS-domain containing protein [Devosiaceae bacterium]